MPRKKSTTEKKTTTKNRRGRPPKKKAIPAEVKDKEKVYNHLRYQRCDRRMVGNAHPSFLKDNTVCNTIMESMKTTDGGKIKHYKCPRCGTIKKVEGKLV